MRSTSPRFFVLGGPGAIGRIVVRDLLASNPAARVTVADVDERRAVAFARGLDTRRAVATFGDARDARDLARRLEGHAVVVNCTQHAHNLEVMRAALGAGTHYVDLGGLFVWTRRQLRLHREFEQARRTAIIGMGCAPGITNLLARLAVDALGQVERIQVRVASIDLAALGGAFAFPYSAQTIVEELTLAPWVFRDGRFATVPARSGWEEIRFPQPVGRASLVCTRHSEVATIPTSFRAQGVRHCDFKVGFDRAFVDEVMNRLDGGWAVARLSALQTPRCAPDDHEIARVVAVGPRTRGARRGARLTLDVHASAKPEWEASAGDLDTGCPPSIVAQMLADGWIAACGVLPPEIGVPAHPFFEQLAGRGMQLTVRRD